LEATGVGGTNGLVTTEANYYAFFAPIESE
jgi:hypothetical protein